MTIILDQIQKQFGDLTAIRDVSLTLPSKTLYTVVGPAGSGKSTLLAMAAGIIKPSSGVITYKGEVGYIPEAPLQEELLTGSAYIEATATLKHIPRDVWTAHIAHWSERWSLTEALAVPLNKSTKRIRFLVALLAATVYKPQLLIIDEPEQDMLPMVLAIKGPETTLLVATSHVAIARKLESDAALLSQGVIQGEFAKQSIDELSRAYHDIS